MDDRQKSFVLQFTLSHQLFVPNLFAIWRSRISSDMCCSVALVVDNPEFFNRIAETFTSKASLRFLILLWGEKSSLVAQGEQIPVYSYTEIKNLGQERRAKLSGSNNTSTLRIYIFL